MAIAVATALCAVFDAGTTRRAVATEPRIFPLVGSHRALARCVAMPALTLAEMIIPPLPFVVTLGWMAVRKTRLQSWRQAEGVVIEMVRGRKRTKKPRVQFTSALGRSAIFTARIASHPPSYAVGQAVPVLYDPGQPERAIIDSFGERWGAEIAFAILALLLLPNLLYAGIHHLGW